MSHGEFFEATGTERVPVYGVWKAQQGYPVYENPFAESFALSMYNYAFYYGYAAVATAFGWQNEQLVTGSRLHTATWSMVGAGALVALVAASTRERLRGRRLVFAAAGAASIWLSSTAIGWWAISVRPDMVSATWAVAGLACWTLALRDQRPRDALIASLLFSIAWSFKQSTVAMFGGAALAGLLALRFGLVAMLVGPYLLVVAATLLATTEWHRFNILTVPTITRLDAWAQQWQYVVKVFAPNPHVVILPGVAFWAWYRGDRSSFRIAMANNVGVASISVVVLAAAAWCGLGLMREGGDRNTLLELYLAVSALSLVLALDHGAGLGGPRWRRLFVSLAVLAASGVPTAQLILFDRIGDLNFGTSQEVAAARHIAAVLSTLPKPAFVEQHMFALPWYSTNDRYPAVVLDDYYYNTVPARARVRQIGGLESLVTRGTFPTLLLTGQFRLNDTARQKGYERSDVLEPTPPWRLTLYERQQHVPSPSPGGTYRTGCAPPDTCAK